MKLFLFRLIGVVAVACLLGCVMPVAAQVTLTGSSYTQNFNGLANTGTTHAASTLPAGWFFQEVEGTSANGTYRVGNGSANTGDTYSFGSTSTTDRALGSITSNTLKLVAFGAAFTNNTTQYVTNITISFANEQWRRGNNVNQQPYDFAYAFDQQELYNEDTEDDWQLVPAGNFNTIQTGGPASPLDGNVASNRVVVSFSLPDGIAPGETLWIRWVDVDNSGEDHGHAIDDFNMTWNLSNCPPVQLSIAGPSSVCTGQEVTLNASVVNGENSMYTWSLPGGTSATGASLNLGVLSASGIYSVSVTNSCGTDQASISINVFPQPDITSVVLDPAGPVYCGNPGELFITVNPMQGVTYSYQTNNGFLDQNDNVGLYDFITDGPNYVIINTYIAGCSDSDTVYFYVNSPDEVPVFLPVAPVCEYDNSPELPTTSVNGITGTWSPASVNTAIAGLQTLTFTPNEEACGQPTTIQVLVNALPNAAINPTFVELAGQPATLTASGGTMYNWNTGQSTAAIVVNQPGVYLVTVTDQNGCQSQASANVIQGEVPYCPLVTVNAPVVMGNKAMLSWDAGNYTSFRLQFRKRTTPKSVWTSVSFPAGSTSFTTPVLEPGIHMWRLRSVCPNGTSSGFVRGANFKIVANSGFAAGDVQNLTSAMQVYPNPASSALNVSFANAEATYQIRLTDHTGRTIYTATTRNAHTILVEDLIDGMYTLTVIDADGRVESKQVVVFK
jgi:hypothetical protein